MDRLSRKLERRGAVDSQDEIAQKLIRLEELRAGRLITETTKEKIHGGWSRQITIGERFKLSIVAGDGMYSTPRNNSLNSIDLYEAVEIALFDSCNNGEWMSGNKGNAPTKWYADLTDHDDVGAYVPWQSVVKLVTELSAFAVDGRTPVVPSTNALARGVLRANRAGPDLNHLE